jgi:ParB family transcriptional regulator, chromosome partitioning protein
LKLSSENKERFFIQFQNPKVLILQLPLESIRFNPYNSRSKYVQSEIIRLAHSLKVNGQLAVVKVRSDPSEQGKYQLVYGHRRVMAARRLGWKTIRAEVVETSDEQMIEQSLVENFERECLSDYDKALIFERLNREFGRTYDEIGRLLGLSKQHVSNHLAMLRLFDPKDLAANPELLEALQQMSEHHARVLSRIEDTSTKIDVARLIGKDKLSVKELTNMVGRLRSWFARGERKVPVDSLKISTRLLDELDFGRLETSEGDIEQVTRVIVNEFKLAHTGDFETYRKMHLFGEGFSIYSAFPPFERIEEQDAMYKERDWFFRIAPKLSWRIKDLKINLLGETALATLRVSYLGRYKCRPFKMDIRGTVVLIAKDGEWKILHEHWSRLEKKSIREKSVPEIHHSQIISR